MPTPWKRCVGGNHAVLVAALALGAVVAVWVPAREASRTDPMAVLRRE